MLSLGEWFGKDPDGGLLLLYMVSLLMRKRHDDGKCHNARSMVEKASRKAGEILADRSGDSLNRKSLAAPFRLQ